MVVSVSYGRAMIMGSSRMYSKEGSHHGPVKALVDDRAIRQAGDPGARLSRDGSRHVEDGAVTSLRGFGELGRSNHISQIVCSWRQTFP